MSKAAPTVLGVQLSITMPFGTYTKDVRMGAWAALAGAAKAGTMASSMGRAIAAPMPRRNVRRSRCFCVTNIRVSFTYHFSLAGCDETYRFHMSDRRSLMGASLAAETNESRDGESRLKAGCSQDWPPHEARGFLG